MTNPLEVRSDQLAHAESAPVDVIVVGGGINGVGIALDASARGLRTVLVERDDLAVGTSSRSSKLIHGGLRYLEHFEFGLVREALAERHLLSTLLAPHLVHIERFAFPVYGSWWQVPYTATGLLLYDLLGGRRAGRFRHLTRTEATTAIPGLRQNKLKGAFEYSDGVFDDARLVVAIARTASRLGVSVITRCEVIEWIPHDGANSGVRVKDRITGEKKNLEARVVIDATGVFDFEPGGTETLQPSRGTHLLVPRSKLPITSGLTIRVDERVVFVIPWGDNWLVGTTDVPHHGAVDRPIATREEISYLLAALADVLDVQLKFEDIVSTFAGIRPLVGDGEDTADISREDAIGEPEPGRITVRGGKYTTYRKVAERVVDFAASRVGEIPPSPTARLPIAGAMPTERLAALGKELTTTAGVDITTAQHLVSRYGSDAFDVAMTATDQGLAAPLIEGLPYLRAEAAWAIHHEYALSIDDVLARRTRIALEDRGHGAGAAEFVGDLLSQALGWSNRQKEAAVEDYRRTVAIEYGVPKPSLQGVDR